MVQGRKRPIIAVGTEKVYGSIKEAAEDMGVISTSIQYALKHGTRCRGQLWVYFEEELEPMATGLLGHGRRKGLSVKHPFFCPPAQHLECHHMRDTFTKP
eukprot:g28426.t1